MNLYIKKSIKLKYTAPFSFQKTFYFPSKLELYKEKIYYLPLNFKKDKLGLKFYQTEEELYIDIYSFKDLSKKFIKNASVQRTISMCRNVMSQYGMLTTFDNVQLYSFWNIEDFNPTDEELRVLKAGYRSKNILRITQHFKENLIKKGLSKLPISKLVKELLKIYGVDKQTGYYLILGQFHRTKYLEYIPL